MTSTEENLIKSHFQDENNDVLIINKVIQF